MNNKDAQNAFRNAIVVLSVDMVEDVCIAANVEQTNGKETSEGKTKNRMQNVVSHGVSLKLLNQAA
jgi:hypothetical protein